MSRLPKVSVIVATYNRSQVLKHAVRSVIASTFTDWELIVVGDCCTDDTEECVASFRDARIRFVNLPHNTGDQGGPNNHGITLARGRYIAFLNHDDIHLPDHLATCVAELDREEADLVWVPAAVAQKAPDRRPDQAPLTFALVGVPPHGGYSPFAAYYASTWVFRRELAGSVGPWPAADSVYVTPSQAWLFRAWRSGARLKLIPRVGVVIVLSGERRGSYALRESPDHELLARWMGEDGSFRERMLEEAAIRAAAAAVFHRYETPGKAILRGLAHPIYSLLAAMGMHPMSLNMAIRYGGKGRLIRYHRQLTGVR